MKIESLEDNQNEDTGSANEENKPGQRGVCNLANSHYYPDLTYMENMKLNLMSYQAHINGGLTTSEMK